jgi:hypothetical protein
LDFISVLLFKQGLIVHHALAGAAEFEVELVQGRVGPVAAGHGGAAGGKIFDQDQSVRFPTTGSRGMGWSALARASSRSEGMVP